MSRNPFSFPVPIIFLAIIYFLSPAESSKLKEVIIRSIDQVFDGSNNVIASLASLPVGGNNINASTNPWQNEGFIGANATQITSSFGSTIGISTKLLLATKASTLSTQLNDFSQTFLVIKFSSIIGHTEPQVDVPLSTTAEEDEEITTSASPNEDEVEEFPHSTLVYPRNKEEIKGANNPSYLQTLAKSSQQKLSPVISPLAKTVDVPPPPKPPAILKLSAEGSDGHQVIEIAIDPATLLNNSGLPPPPEISFGDMQTANKKAERRRRELNLNSEEISEIHKILTLTKNIKQNIKEKSEQMSNKADKPETKLASKPKSKTIQEEIISEQDAEGAEELAKDEEIDKHEEPMSMSIKGLNTGKKLSYQTWRASLDKSFRPPGFYVTVDEKVIFDNFEGVWQSSQSPTVMGRWSSPKKNGIWNDTVLMLQYDENPDRNIKISFEWEPMDPNAYLFLSNISISTYGGNASDIGPQYSGDDSSTNVFGGNNNRNITLYIVLKSPAQGTEHVIRMGDKVAEVVEQRGIQIEPNSNNIANNPSTPKPTPSITIIEIPDVQSTSSKSSGGNTGLIVACITGCLSFVILVFLVAKKLQINKSPNHQNHLYNINEL